MRAQNNDLKRYIAHVRQSDNAHQALHAHLSQVGEIASSSASKLGLTKAGALIGLMHDFGKYSQAFQQYIQSATGRIDADADDFVDAKALKGKIDHSSAGAQWVYQQLARLNNAGRATGLGELCGQILALCIASHHSGLIDCLAIRGDQTFQQRMDKLEEKTFLQECISAADRDITEKAQALAGAELIRELAAAIQRVADFSVYPKELSKRSYFNLGFLVRFLFSCLIDADRLDSAEFEDPQKRNERLQQQGIPDWQVALTRLEARLSAFPLGNEVDGLRRDISNWCCQRAAEAQGVYTLTVPTGGGKTYASLRYAIRHANVHRLELIIYIIPYTSIIEQNAEVIRDAVEQVGDARPWVLEHHSNLEPEKQTWRTKLVSENWDAPIVLTTMVQFLETLFAGGTRSARRLHQLANSVLIFDEIQTLPVNCVHLFCNALNFLTTYAKTTVVLCTATQPLLNRLKSPEKGQLYIADSNELIQDKYKLFEDLKRVRVVNCYRAAGWSAGEISDLVLSELQKNDSCLVIVNTKAWAQKLYQQCVGSVSSDVIFHLSTNQCAAHRKTILDQVRSRLKQQLPVLCISTQLIEAGVDVDFASVVRFFAGLDSIAQAAGRCNRNGRRPMGTVHLVNPATESIDQLVDIKIGKEKTLRILSETESDLLSPDTMTRYFRYYFFDRADDMTYPLDAKRLGRTDTLLNLLTDNPMNEGCRNSVRRESGKLPMLEQSFMAAGHSFEVINAPTQAVVVQYGKEGKELVAELCAVAKEFNAPRYYELLKHAQKYSVNVFPNIWRKLLEEQAVYEINAGDGIYYLDERHYSDDFGLSAEPVALAGLLGIW